MSADKRTVSTDALETLGFIHVKEEGRDAIHLAVEPVVAAELLQPGQHVGFVKGGVGSCDDPVGIVDPFLVSPVLEGQRFWLVVYPRQITSLRHVWTHPAFGDDRVPVSANTMDTSVSEKWLRDFLDHADCPGYEKVMAAIFSGDCYADWDDEHEYLHFRGHDAHGEIPPDFWTHVEIVLGIPMPKEDRAKYFSCSC